MYNKITLIGMPWAGKTTISKALAESLHYDLLDLDLEVEQATNMGLIELMNSKGPGYFRTMGFEFLKKLKPEVNVVISPAGSVIFHQPSMKWIKENSFVLFLNTPFEVIEQRSKLQPKAVADLETRGLKSIWDERIPIYTRYADEIINTDNYSVIQIIDQIKKIIKP